eukprot:COSAG05_NODE_22053_length_267_cov_0.916667_1_plen_42_part_01
MEDKLRLITADGGSDGGKDESGRPILLVLTHHQPLPSPPPSS